MTVDEVMINYCYFYASATSASTLTVTSSSYHIQIRLPASNHLALLHWNGKAASFNSHTNEFSIGDNQCYDMPAAKIIFTNLDMAKVKKEI